MSKRISPAATGTAGTSISNVESIIRRFESLSNRVGLIEAGAHRGPNSSFGLPFKLVGPNGTFEFFVNGSGQLCVVSPSSTVTVIAPP